VGWGGGELQEERLLLLSKFQMSWQVSCSLNCLFFVEVAANFNRKPDNRSRCSERLASLVEFDIVGFRNL
jgi:hypothetical protein